jgi:hypothetical protein
MDRRNIVFNGNYAEAYEKGSGQIKAVEAIQKT